jgi:hypothetical protein
MMFMDGSFHEHDSCRLRAGPGLGGVVACA